MEQDIVFIRRFNIQKEELRGTLIYRYGGYEGRSKLVPSQNDVAEMSGLSFSTVYRNGAFVTTMELLNQSGVVLAVRDGKKHVSVFPIGGTIKDWYDQGPNSVWTDAIWKRGFVISEGVNG